jgi:hypothetical protein
VLFMNLRLNFIIFLENCVNMKEFIRLNNVNIRPPLWYSGQSFWIQIQRSRIRFPALPDFLRSRGSERGPLRLVRIIEGLLE